MKDELLPISGEGDTKIVLSDHQGLVVMHFGKPLEWIAIAPATAVSLAEQLARQSYRAKFGDYPAKTARSQIGEQVVIRLRNRITLMLRSMQKNDTNHRLQAERIVDVVLKEVG